MAALRNAAAVCQWAAHRSGAAAATRAAFATHAAAVAAANTHSCLTSGCRLASHRCGSVSGATPVAAAWQQYRGYKTEHGAGAAGGSHGHSGGGGGGSHGAHHHGAESDRSGGGVRGAGGALMRLVAPGVAAAQVAGGAPVTLETATTAAAGAGASAGTGTGAMLDPSWAGTGTVAVSTATCPANASLEDRWAVMPWHAMRPAPIPGRAVYVGEGSGAPEAVPPPLPPHRPYMFAAVFDGHGGWQVADYGMNHLPGAVALELEHAGDPTDPAQVAAALTRAFQRTDRAYLDAVRGAFEVGFSDVARVGACALAAVACRDWVVVANAGDCRAVLGHVTCAAPGSSKSSSSGGGEDTLYMTSYTLSEDHNARLPREVARLRAAHPGEPDIVTCKAPGACYVKGRLQPTRGLGDAYLKASEFNAPAFPRHRGRHIPPPYTPPYNTATPETKVLWLTDTPACGAGGGAGGAGVGGAGVAGGSDGSSLRSSGAQVINVFGSGAGALPDRHTFLILACDGVWDVLSSEAAVKFVAEDDGDATSVASRLVHHVLTEEARGSHMSVTDLMAMPQGRERRRIHDDLTVVVMFLGEDGSVSSTSSSSAAAASAAAAATSPAADAVTDARLASAAAAPANADAATSADGAAAEKKKSSWLAW